MYRGTGAISANLSARALGGATISQWWYLESFLPPEVWFTGILGSIPSMPKISAMLSGKYEQR